MSGQADKSAQWFLWCQQNSWEGEVTKKCEWVRPICTEGSWVANRLFGRGR